MATKKTPQAMFASGMEKIECKILSAPILSICLYTKYMAIAKKSTLEYFKQSFNPFFQFADILSPFLLGPKR